MISKQIKLLAAAGLLLAANETVCGTGYQAHNRMGGTQDPLGIYERLQAQESAKRIAAAEHAKAEAEQPVPGTTAYWQKYLQEKRSGFKTGLQGLTIE